MSTTVTKEITELVEMLPETEQNLAYELVKRLVIAWDSDFTKLTPNERQQLEQAEKDFITGDTISHDQINWN